jgi:hypothetical protein
MLAVVVAMVKEHKALVALVVVVLVLKIQQTMELQTLAAEAVGVEERTALIKVVQEL